MKQYIEFVQHYEASLDTYINLDVIPGSKGVRPTVREVEYAAAKSFDNYEAMLAAGLNPIPVFHYGENFRWLEKLVEAGADYVCVGGTVGMKTPTKRKFLDDCFTILTNARGEPLVRVHGLGVTEGKLVIRYPWYSVDSTSWLIAPIYGMVLVPGLALGSFSSQIYIADGNLSKGKDGRRFERLPLAAQNHVLSFAEECDVSIADMRNDIWSRMTVFVMGTLKMGEHIPDTFRYRTGNFLQSKELGISPINKLPIRIVFATDMALMHQTILKKCGVKNQLWSFYTYKDDALLFNKHLDFINNDDWYDPKYRPAHRRGNWKSTRYHDHRRRQLLNRSKEDESEQEAAV